jgi:uncharacterized protein (TIGR03000 family)
MFRAGRTALVLPAVVATLLWTAGPLLARGPHGGGGFHGGGSHGGHVAVVHGGHVGGFHAGHVAPIHGGHVANFHGGFHTAHVGSFHGGHFGHFEHGGRFEHGRRFFGGWGFGGLGYYGGYPYYGGVYGGYPDYDYYSAPTYNYVDVQPYVTTPGYSDYYYNSGPESNYYYNSVPESNAPTTPSVPPTMDAVPPTTTDTAAHLDVRVPASAEVWVEGAKTKQTGSLRHFVSPPLTPGRSFTYSIRARWTDANGQVVDQTRQVPVQAGGQVVENFTAPAAGE